MIMKPGQLINRSRHEIWHDVTRRKAPALSRRGQAAKRRRWLVEYGRLSDVWRDRYIRSGSEADLDMSIYWAQRAAAAAEDERGDSQEEGQ